MILLHSVLLSLTLSMGCGVSRFEPEDALGSNHRFHPLPRHRGLVVEANGADTEVDSLANNDGRTSTSSYTMTTFSSNKDDGVAKEKTGRTTDVGVDSRTSYGTKSCVKGGEEEIEEEKCGDGDEGRLLFPRSPSFRYYCIDYSESDDGGSCGGDGVKEKNEKSGEDGGERLSALNSANEKGSQGQPSRSGGRGRRRLKGVLPKSRAMKVKKFWNANLGSPSSSHGNQQKSAGKTTVTTVTSSSILTVP